MENKPLEDPKETPTRRTERTRCEVWTRVMGYHRPVSQYNLGKKSEHYSRAQFDEKNAKLESSTL